MEQISDVEEEVLDSKDCSFSSLTFDSFWYFNRGELAKLEQGKGRYKIIKKCITQGMGKDTDVDWKLSTLSLVNYPPNAEGMIMPIVHGMGDLETKSVESYHIDSVDALRGMGKRMIFQQRAGRAINLDMIKTGIDLFVEVDHNGKRCYYRNIEQVLLSHTDARYSKLANEWLLTCSFHEYLKKDLNCMYIEERRMGHQLPWNTMENLVEATRYELMDKRIRTAVKLLFCNGRHAF